MSLQATPTRDEAAKIVCDAVVVGSFSSAEGVSLAPAAADLDAALDRSLSEYLVASGFRGKGGEIATMPTLGRISADTAVVVGLGDRSEVDTNVVRRAAGSAARRLADRAVVAIDLHAVRGDDSAAAFAEGFILGAYRFTTYKSNPQTSKTERLIVVGASAEEVERASVVAQAVQLARDLTNEPPSNLTPEVLVSKAREIADVGGLECTVLDETELERRGFGGLLGVGRGSVQAPRLIQLRYAPDGAITKVVLIGKGVTFDSGGLSLKDPKNMETMKTDMAGAAAVLGAMSALPHLAPKVEVLGLAPATENMPGGRALKPGDVLRHYGGKTTEVNNTDAEGRLILADALAFASEQKPDAIVDVATLTGAVMVALGRKIAGLFSNDDALATELEGAADAAGERLWRMPIFDDYHSELDSEIADQKNSGSRYGGSIIAALFLKQFVGPSIPWAHLDIAGTARAESDYDESPKGGTGASTRTLINWVMGRAR
jgi:leucyl aminopeptidase